MVEIYFIGLLKIHNHGTFEIRSQFFKNCTSWFYDLYFFFIICYCFFKLILFFKLFFIVISDLFFDFPCFYFPVFELKCLLVFNFTQVRKIDFTWCAVFNFTQVRKIYFTWIAMNKRWIDFTQIARVVDRFYAKWDAFSARSEPFNRINSSIIGSNVI